MQTSEHVLSTLQFILLQHSVYFIVRETTAWWKSNDTFGGLLWYNLLHDSVYYVKLAFATISNILQRVNNCSLCVYASLHVKRWRSAVNDTPCISFICSEANQLICPTTLSNVNRCSEFRPCTWSVKETQCQQKWLQSIEKKRKQRKSIYIAPCIVNHLKALRHGSHSSRWCLHWMWGWTSNCSPLLIYRPREDERLSWPGWLTNSGRLTHISGHPSATGRAQDGEITLARDWRSTA